MTDKPTSPFARKHRVDAAQAMAAMIGKATSEPGKVAKVRRFAGHRIPVDAKGNVIEVVNEQSPEQAEHRLAKAEAKRAARRRRNLGGA